MSSKRETSPEAFSEQLAALVVGADLVVSYANAAAHRLFGYREGALVGMYLELLAPGERRLDLFALTPLLRSQQGRRIQSEALHTSGSRIEVMVSLQPLVRDRGEVAGLIVTYRRIAPWGR